MPIFTRMIGIDYSGAETPTASLKGLRVYTADGDRLPAEVPPPPSPRKYWTRKGIAKWLVEWLAEDVPTLAGIDHGFSFPLRYFEAHRLLPKWSRFLDDFQRHWPTDEDHTYVQFVRDGIHGNGARMGNARWRREIGLSLGRARIGGEIHPRRHSLATFYPSAPRHPHVHFWPFDGWDIQAGSLGHRGSLPGANETEFRARQATSTMPSASLPGCRAPIGMATSRVSLILF